MAQPQHIFASGREDRRTFEHTPAERATLVQSRETGDILPDDTLTPRGQVKALPFAKSWVHFMAGGYALSDPPRESCMCMIWLTEFAASVA